MTQRDQRERERERGREGGRERRGEGEGEGEREREKGRGRGRGRRGEGEGAGEETQNLNQLSFLQLVRSAIHASWYLTSPIGFLFLKLSPPPCAVLLVSILFARLWACIRNMGQDFTSKNENWTNRVFLHGFTMARFRNLMSTAAGQKFLNENLHRTSVLSSRTQFCVWARQFFLFKNYHFMNWRQVVALLWMNIWINLVVARSPRGWTKLRLSRSHIPVMSPRRVWNSVISIDPKRFRYSCSRFRIRNAGWNLFKMST